MHMATAIIHMHTRMMTAIIHTLTATARLALKITRVGLKFQLPMPACRGIGPIYTRALV